MQFFEAVEPYLAPTEGVGQSILHVASVLLGFTTFYIVILFAGSFRRNKTKKGWLLFGDVALKAGVVTVLTAAAVAPFMYPFSWEARVSDALQKRYGIEVSASTLALKEVREATQESFPAIIKLGSKVDAQRSDVLFDTEAGVYTQSAQSGELYLVVDGRVLEIMIAESGGPDSKSWPSRLTPFHGQ